MLQMLLRRDMRYVVAVVTRYYGGVKLGAGGLIRAYGGVGRRGPRRARHASPAGASGWPPSPSTTSGRASCRTTCGATGREVRDVRYGEAVTIEIGLPDADVHAFRAWLADATAGTAGFELGGEAYGDA